MTANRSKRATVGLALLALAVPAFADESAPVVPPFVPTDTTATKPAVVDPATAKLVDELGDADPSIREAASQKLAQLGRSALPALNEAKEADDPEIRSRVRSLIRKAERHLPPAAPARNGFANRKSVRVSSGNGEKTINVDDNGYRIKIRQTPSGIAMDVTGSEEGKEVTESYQAKDAEELKHDNPEAFALYEKYSESTKLPMFGRGQAMNAEAMRAEAMQRQEQILREIAERMQENQRDGAPNQGPAQMQEQIDRLRNQQRDMHQKLMQDLDQNRRKMLDEMRVPEREGPPEPPKKNDDMR